MKFQRTNKGVTIELDWYECEKMKSIVSFYINDNEHINYDPSGEQLCKAIHSELDEMLTEEGT